nr:hypothetical protein [Tanacetum cinerariifolium]
KSTSLTISTINRVSTLRTILRGSLRQVGCFIKITNDLVPETPIRTTVFHREEEKQIEEEQAAKVRYWKIPVFYDYDDDDDYTIAITPKEPDNSLSMRDEYLDTIHATKSNEFIKSSVENLVQNPSESEGEHECDVPACEIDYLFDEFAGELTLLNSIPPGINETDCDLEKETCFIKRLLYDNSSPHPPEEFNSKNSDTTIESFSSSPIPIEDSDSLMEEIDLSFTPDDPM